MAGMSDIHKRDTIKVSPYGFAWAPPWDVEAACDGDAYTVATELPRGDTTNPNTYPDSIYPDSPTCSVCHCLPCTCLSDNPPTTSEPRPHWDALTEECHDCGRTFSQRRSQNLETCSVCYETVCNQCHTEHEAACWK